MRSFGGVVALRGSSSSRRGVLRADLLRGFVDILDGGAGNDGGASGISGLLDPAQRTLLIDQFERRAGVRLYVPQFDVPRDWCFRFVAGCIDDLDGGAHILVDAVEDLRPRSVLVRRLRCLLDEWEAVEVAEQAGDLWEALRAELREVPARAAARAFRHACYPAQPPEHCPDAWALFLWAAGRVPQGSTLAPHAVFLLRCAELLTPPTRVRVETWLGARAHRDRLTPQLNRARLAAGAPAVGGGRRACALCLQFEPLGRSDLYWVAWWLHWSGELAPHRGPQRPARLADFEDITASVVDKAEEILADEVPPGQLVDLTVELVLPTEHLALPVTGWSRPVGGARRLLLRDHALVVRSYDRAHWPEATRFRWSQRWSALADAERGAVWAVDVAQIGAYGLDVDQRIAAVTLSGPPAPDTVAHRQLAGALQAGLGVAAWQHPDPDRPDSDVPLLELLTDGDPLGLPQRFRSENLARLEPLGDLGVLDDPARARDTASRRAATLLWDDPHRIAGRASVPMREQPAGSATAAPSVRAPAPAVTAPAPAPPVEPGSWEFA
ncbi:hypothetical protein MXD95_020780 [Frankia sp. AiPa1]|nr:hypothetical protein [Frankia sp. AiPa1]